MIIGGLNAQEYELSRKRKVLEDMQSQRDIQLYGLRSPIPEEVKKAGTVWLSGVVVYNAFYFLANVPRGRTYSVITKTNVVIHKVKVTGAKDGSKNIRYGKKTWNSKRDAHKLQGYQFYFRVRGPNPGVTDSERNEHNVIK